MESSDPIGLADDPALDFVNSTATPAQGVVELIRDGRSYLDLLEQAALLDRTDTAEVRERFPVADLDAVAAEAVAFREWLRPVIAAWADQPGSDATVPLAVASKLNDILRRDRGFSRVQRGETTSDLVRTRHWHDPQQLLVPPAEAVARLLTTGDRSLVRNCEGPTCTLWFYDRTKSHRRRWCSMAVCGNRAKARAHRERTR